MFDLRPGGALCVPRSAGRTLLGRRTIRDWAWLVEKRSAVRNSMEPENGH